MISKLKLSLLYVILTIFCIITLLPLFWTFIISIKSPKDLAAAPVALAFRPSLENYQRALIGVRFAKFFQNSFVIAITSAAIAIILTVPAGYVSARFGVGGQFLKQWILSMWFLPPVVTAIPIFILMQFLKILDTYLALLIPYLLMNIPFSFLLLTSFIQEVPKELEEAALVDGCSRLQAFWKIIFPLTLPGFLITFAFCFMFAWNEYFFALILTGTKRMTLPVHITSYLSIHSIAWGEVAAVGMIMTVPMLILLIVIQKYLVKGLTMGALQS
jgi:multiple sugar transport system permease protein